MMACFKKYTVVVAKGIGLRYIILARSLYVFGNLIYPLTAPKRQLSAV